MKAMLFEESPMPFFPHFSIISNCNMAYPLNYEAGATQAPLIRLLQRNLEKPFYFF
jgi:hypothetical protein